MLLTSSQLLAGLAAREMKYLQIQIHLVMRDFKILFSLVCKVLIDNNSIMYKPEQQRIPMSFKLKE